KIAQSDPIHFLPHGNAERAIFVMYAKGDYGMVETPIRHSGQGQQELAAIKAYVIHAPTIRTVCLLPKPLCPEFKARNLKDSVAALPLTPTVGAPTSRSSQARRD